MNVWTSEKEFQYSEQSWPESAAIRHIRQGICRSTLSVIHCRSAFRWRVQVCKRYCRVIGERSMMALSVCPCRLHVRDRWSMKGLISILSCCILFVSVVGCWLSTVGCRVSVLVGCRVYLSVVVPCCGCRISVVECLTVGCLVPLSMIVVGSWLSIVWCWMLIVGVDCRSFFPFVGAHLWLSESLNFCKSFLLLPLTTPF